MLFGASASSFAAAGDLFGAGDKSVGVCRDIVGTGCEPDGLIRCLEGRALSRPFAECGHDGTWPSRWGQGRRNAVDPESFGVDPWLPAVVTCRGFSWSGMMPEKTSETLDSRARDFYNKA